MLGVWPLFARDVVQFGNDDSTSLASVDLCVQHMVNQCSFILGVTVQLDLVMASVAGIIPHVLPPSFAVGLSDVRRCAGISACEV